MDAPPLLQGLSLADLFFYLLAGLVLGSAAVVVFSRNIIYSAYALLATLLGVAGLYIYLAADFIAVIQIMVYVGGILTLILFAVMMTNRIDQVNLSNQSVSLWVALPVGAVLATVLGYCARRTPWVTLKLPAANPSTSKIGDAFLGDYLLPFEIASIVLLVALVGAVVMARHQVRGEFPDERKQA
jgi:NAD(P)H-quinone oxidoreductase subunit 6